MTERPRRLGVGILAAGLLVALAACGGIPTSGSVRAGDPFTDEPIGDFVFIPVGPTKDADQQGILDGFIAAFTGPQGDYATAREFLSSDFKKDWDPRQSVLIRTGIPTFRTIDSTTMEYSFTATAQLDQFGAYTTGAPATQALQFQFVKENGQWRISQAPPGIVLAESTFLTIFSKHALYFYDLSLQYLVPDERWFPGGTTATRVVSALLAGPPEWLKGAVVSQFPDGTRLMPGTTVTIDSTVAQVDLTTEAAAADERQRRLMQLQLAESLSSVSGIASVEVSVAGSLLSIASGGSDMPVAQRAVDSRPLVLADGEFGYLSGGEITPIDQLSAKVQGLEPSAATVGAHGTAAAVLAPGGVYVARTTQAPALLVDDRAGLIAPSFDDFGYIWSVPAHDPDAVVAFDFEGNAHPVAVSLPAGSTIVSLDVSLDNSRVAILLQSAAGPRLLVAAILRDPAQGYIPTSIGAPVIDALISSETAVDATWVDRFSVATLTSTDGDAFVASFEIGGLEVSLGRPAPAVAIVGGNGRTGLRVLTTDNLLQTPRGSSWQSTSATVDIIATQR